jgi:hypothetical protein
MLKFWVARRVRRQGLLREMLIRRLANEERGIKYTRSCIVIRRQGIYIIELSNEFFENVAMFKYFGTAINNQNYIYEKVKCTII